MVGTAATREGSLEAPTRHPIDWKNPKFWDRAALDAELERVYDVCHGCRRCVSLCNAFPTLFDLVDESSTMEVDGVAKNDYRRVVEHCYLCDMCYMSKCPYVPPHEWNIDFPHLMLRAKAVYARQQKPSLRDRLLSSTDFCGSFAGIPIVAPIVNASNRNRWARKAMHQVLGVHQNAPVPQYHSNPFRKRVKHRKSPNILPQATGSTTGKVALFTTCYGNYNEPEINEALCAVFEHNNIAIQVVARERCCGMPKLELGDLDAVAAAKAVNVPELLKLVDQGYDIVAPIPSCVLMFKQELPLMFPDDSDLARLKAAIFDPFEYLMLRHKEGIFNTDFKQPLGKISYHAACHLRVQNIGLKTRDILQLIPETQVETIERCSGHDGTYAVKREYHDHANKIGRPVVNKVKQSDCDYYSSDCPMAGHQIENGLPLDSPKPTHPLALLCIAYGLH